MSTLNTSNITVPTVATMVEHLVDSDPHPQYLISTELLSAISGNVHITDLADVNIGSGAPANTLLVFDGSGTWNGVTASTLFESTLIPYATIATNGVVRLATSTSVLNPLDTSTVVTPFTLDAWATDKQFISSGNLYPAISSIFQSSGAILPVDVEKLGNVTMTPPVSVGQVLAIDTYNSVTGKATWTNSTVTAIKGTTTNFGNVKIATIEETMYGPTQTFAEMELSGHAVPSVAAMQSLMGDTFVSRVSAGTTVSKFSSIIGNVSEAGRTPYGFSTVVNNSGYVADHIVSGGALITKGGPVCSALVVGDNISTTQGTTVVPGVLTVQDRAKAYDLNVGYHGSVIISNGGEGCNIAINGPSAYFLTPNTTFSSGMVYYTRTGREGNFTFSSANVAIGEAVPENTYYNQRYGDACNEINSNVLTVGLNGHAHQVRIGSNYDDTTISNILTSNVNFSQGMVNVNGFGVLEHGFIHTFAKLNVNANGSAYHLNAIGSSAEIIVSSAGYAEDIRIFTGGKVIVRTGGEVKGLAVYGSGELTVESGAIVRGFVKYAGCVINSAGGAVIERVGFTVADSLVYSSGAADYNVSSGTSGAFVVFSAGTHPTGLRKQTTDSNTSEVTHKFYPMAVDERAPNSNDPEYNNYKMDVTGLTLWNDINTSNSYIKWYITF